MAMATAVKPHEHRRDVYNSHGVVLEKGVESP
jgi:hypothetical protein